VSDLVRRDRDVIWHPYTQHGIEDGPLPVRSAHGAVLVLEDGREIIDGISSWWTCLHGHGRPEIVEAMRAQAETLDHVLFAGATHEPAVKLAERLIEVAPKGLSRVFYSDNGSTAVEVALKIAFQAHLQRGEPDRRTFVALEGGYHGDTFGAMAVGDPDPFFRAFEGLLFRVERAAPNVESLTRSLDALGPRCAGVIIEPLVQGAGGMRMHSAAFVAAVRELCDRHGIPMIADEVMTGFGRTGKLFACDHAGVRPDLLCLAKGLTGGMHPLAATLATEELFDAFRSSDRSRALFHGHSFTANPVGCAAALASLDIVQREDVPAKLEGIGAIIESELRMLWPRDLSVTSLRRTGGIVAFDRHSTGTGYLSGDPRTLRKIAIDQGVLLRPLGNTVYAMPPACTSGQECRAIARAMVGVLSAE
jgi:adenosylmethionine-8-amino-7-oxononanoate aminotransferase